MQDRDSPAVKKGEETFGDFKNNPYLCIVFFTELDLRFISVPLKWDTNVSSY